MNQIRPTRINIAGTVTDDESGFPVYSASTLPDPGRDFAAGSVWLINKPAGWSSFRVVGLLRKLTGTKKVGHAGTLDPLATGLLILCTGRATRAITKLIGDDKRYICEIRLGSSTPSYDAETGTNATAVYDHVTRLQIEQVIQRYFTGTVRQIPPMYSALKHKGKPLYKYARKGEEIARSAREVTLFDTHLLEYNEGVIKLQIHCSKGTYIRSIADDLGKHLGTLAHLTGLKRTAIGDFSTENALSLNTIIDIFDPHGNYSISL